MSRLKSGRPWLFLSISLVVAGLWAAIDNRLIGQLDPVLSFLLHWLRAVLTLPLWAGGLVLVVYLGTIATLAYLDVVHGHALPKQPLSVHEVNEINDVREMWMGNSRLVCETAINALDGAKGVLERRQNLFARLLDNQIARLRRAVDAMELSVQNGERKAQIATRFTEVRDAYVYCVFWYNRCLLVDKSLLEEGQDGYFKKPQLRQWAELHKGFASSIDALLKHDGFGDFCKSLRDDLEGIRFEGDPSGFNL